jgi:thiaminase
VYTILITSPPSRPHPHSPHPFTDYLIAQTGPLWEQYVNHPFVVQLGKGTLPMKAFLHFIRQDYSFLFHYARTSALAAYKAKNFEDLAASTFIVQTVLDEVKLHLQVSLGK